MNIRRKKGQRGDALLDSLVGLLIAGFVCLGSGEGIRSSQSLDAKNRFQSDAIYQLDNLLQVQGDSLCSGPSPSISLSNGVNLPVSVSCSSVVMTVPNSFTLSTTVNQITMTVQSVQYFGSPGQIKIVG